MKESQGFTRAFGKKDPNKEVLQWVQKSEEKKGNYGQLIQGVWLHKGAEKWMIGEESHDIGELLRWDVLLNVCMQMC